MAIRRTFIVGNPSSAFRSHPSEVIVRTMIAATWTKKLPSLKTWCLLFATSKTNCLGVQRKTKVNQKKHMSIISLGLLAKAALQGH